MKKAVYGFIVACIIGGGVLGSYLMGELQLFIPISIGALGGFLLYIFYTNWKTKKDGDIPEIDERTVHLLQKYFSMVLYAILFVSGAILLILFGMGIETVEVGTLIVYMMLLYFVVGLGAIITKRV